MTFGLSSSGLNFCPIMEMHLGDKQFVTLLLYLYDIRVFVASIDEMLDCIELAFKRLREFNLKIKPKKCHFFQYSVVFLGYVLSADSISANSSKVSKVKSWPLPTNQKELHSYFGKVPYYQQFILKFNATAKCLCELVSPTNVKRNKKENLWQTHKRKTPEFKWTDKHQKAFDHLKTHLISVPLLGYQDFNRSFNLGINAFLLGWGPCYHKG